MAAKLPGSGKKQRQKRRTATPLFTAVYRQNTASAAKNMPCCARRTINITGLAILLLLYTVRMLYHASERRRPDVGMGRLQSTNHEGY